ncbi:guanylate kinase [Achlya hypogyna]|uniref:guanylate kinase n=1 Tax=Achlya hypogyna TaxID=1202772 RepID=A0A1V9ZBD2_ACHHY|nr:guanylate kinase [Achlya hypogyna]
MDPQATLTFEELSILNERKEEIKRDHLAYLDQHPELKTLMSSFMSAVLMEKPTDVVAFAKAHFDALTPIKIAPAPLVIAGPSGVGKGTLINRLMTKYPELFGFSVSHTTRGPREGEVNGVAYHFVAIDEFDGEVAKGSFLEHANVHGNRYGTSKFAVEHVQAQEKICILDIDVQGVRQVKNAKMKVNYLFVAPPSMADLEKRLRGRGTETEDKIKIRIANAKGEVDFGTAEGNFDKVLVNNDLDEAFAELEETLAKLYPEVRFQ